MTGTSQTIDWPARTRALAETVAAHRQATYIDGELDPSCAAWALLLAAERLLHDAADRIAPPETPVSPAEPDRAAIEEAFVARVMSHVATTLHWLTTHELHALATVPEDRAALTLVLAVARAHAGTLEARPPGPEGASGGARPQGNP